MKNEKRLFAIVLSLSMLCVSTVHVIASASEAEEDFFEYRTGLIPDEYDSEKSRMIKTESEERIAEFDDVQIETAMDLSESDYFPAIGNQGNRNACASWAATYYQFTYEANKLNGIVTTPENTYSPAWTYNFLNGGDNIGTGRISTYEVLMHQGALRMKDYPYASVNWSDNIPAMIDALKTRVDGMYWLDIDTTNTDKIDNPKDSELAVLKRLLCGGKVLSVSARCSKSFDNWHYSTVSGGEHDGEKVAYRADDADTTHAITIVGYDDNIRCDFNGDGTIQPSERGAFKVANSWRPDWRNGNDGYIWVMYDALNYQTANMPNQWEANKENRISIFDHTNNEVKNKNTFWFIDVSNHDVDLVGLLSYTTNNRYGVNISTSRKSGTEYSTKNPFKTSKNIYKAGTNMYFSGTIVFDFGEYDCGEYNCEGCDKDNIVNYLTSEWGIKVENLKEFAGENNVTSISYKVVDNKNNLIRNYGVLSSSLSPGGIANRTLNLNLQLGDVNYSRTLTEEDAQLVLKISAAMGVGKNTYSDLQKHLADYNQDGDVDATDASLIYGALPASSAAAFQAYIESEYEAITSGAAVQTYSAEDDDAYNEAYAAVVSEVYQMITAE